MEIKRYLKGVTINMFVVEDLKSSSHDRLGDFVTFWLDTSYPNEKISAQRVSEWFKHIMALLGYTFQHMTDHDFGEMADCWIYPDFEWSKLRIVHKYFSYSQCMFIVKMIKALFEYMELPVETIHKPK